VLVVGQVRVPKQLVVEGDSSCIPTSVAEAGLKLPLGKPSGLCFDLCWHYPSFLNLKPSNIVHINVC
jgi:hypothetical protein